MERSRKEGSVDVRRMSRILVLMAVTIAILVSVAAAPAAATTIISHKTIRDAVIPAGTHDRIYDHVTFVGGGIDRAVLSLSKACHDITFRDCTIASGLWNGITINDRGGDIYDITFVRCRILSQQRMGLECTSRPTSSTTGYHGIRVLQCVFAPQGSEAISFDGGPGCVNNVVDHTTIRGAGINPALPYGSGFECNGVSRFRFTNNKVYACRQALLNLQMHSVIDCGWVFTGNHLDATVHVQKVPMEPLAQVVSGEGICGGVFRDNVVTSDRPGGGVAWFGDCHGMDWRSTSWHDARGGLYVRPYQQNGSSRNRF